jgi:plastocyanin
MRRMTILLLVTLSLLLVSCTDNLPSTPPAPGETKGTAIAGQAFTQELAGQYAEPTTFAINKDLFVVDEILTATVSEELIFKKGYFFNKLGNWQEFNFIPGQGAQIISQDWISNTAEVSITLISNDFAEGGENYILAYACTNNNGWDCHNNLWMAHQFEISYNQGCQSNADCPGQICIAGQCINLPSQPQLPSEPVLLEVTIPLGSSVPGCEETDECFIPDEITIGMGDELTWQNDDSASHTVTSGSPEKGPDGKFDSGLFASGTSFAHIFSDAGTFEYFCMVHPWMKGIVQVS